jgi:hypothetical protein
LIELHPIETRPVNTTAGAKMNMRLFLPLPSRAEVRRRTFEVLMICRIELDEHFVRLPTLFVPDKVQIRGPVPGAAPLFVPYKSCFRRRVDATPPSA